MSYHDVDLVRHHSLQSSIDEEFAEMESRPGEGGAGLAAYATITFMIVATYLIAGLAIYLS